MQRNALFKRYGLSLPRENNIGPYGYDNKAWDALRSAMARRFAKSIDSATVNGTKTLIVLIHGFNVADTTHAITGQPCADTQTKAGHIRKQKYYDAIHNAIVYERPELVSAAWLEVYWDGFQENATSIWGAAQLSARLF